jgi:hypothetical protein
MLCHNWFRGLSFPRKRESKIAGILDSASKPALSAAEWVRNNVLPNQSRKTINDKLKKSNIKIKWAVGKNSQPFVFLQAE